MKFRSLIIKNIFRNKSRSFLAVFGIAIGVAAIVSLGLVTDGLSAATQNALTAGAADFSVVNATSSNSSGGTRILIGGGQVSTSSGTTQLINQSIVSEIQQVQGVGNAVGALSTMTNLNSSGSSGSGSTASLIGISSSDISLDDISITDGSVYSNNQNEVIIGTAEAKYLNKTVGDTISIYSQTFKIVGIYETGNFVYDRGIAMSLTNLQNLTGNTGEISLILVKAGNGINATDLAQTIQQKYPNELTTTTSLSGMTRTNNGLGVVSSFASAVSLFAILFGGVIVIVTMLKAVSERTREIGVLRAIGWTKRSILELIMGESMILSAIATVIGLVIGIGAVEVLASAYIQPAFSANLILRAVGVALFLGIIGGIYPAYRASRLAPTEALRYE